MIRIRRSIRPRVLRRMPTAAESGQETPVK
jgi:hypothetical protein